MNEVNLDDVVLSEEAVAAYHAFANRLGRLIAAAGVAPDQIANERARVTDDGSLVVYVTLPSGEVSMTIPPGQWGWARRQ